MKTLMALTDLKIRSLKPEDKTRKYSDDGGLFIQVSSKGSKLWRMAYRYQGKQRTLSFGAYPATTLSMARAKRDEAKHMLAKNIDPGREVKREKLRRRGAAENTFQAVAEELLLKQTKEGKSPVTLNKKRWLLSMAYSAFGAFPITDITAADILGPLRDIEAKGKYETAHRLRSTIGQVFRYGIATARCENDPTYGLRGALVSPSVVHRAAVTDKEAFEQLVKDVWSYDGAPTTVIGLKLMAFLYPRPGELRHAEWQEFDLEKAVWTIPANKTKMRKEHKKPLPPIVLEVLKCWQPEHAKGFVLPASTTHRKPMSENTLNQALRRMGYKKDQATSHGFRSSASSLLNESGLWSADAIEAELAHVGANEVRRAYHRARYWDERVNMAKWWSEQIEKYVG